jgi:hypothetical protein
MDAMRMCDSIDDLVARQLVVRVRAVKSRQIINS